MKQRDPFRVKKDEFLHMLSQMHKGQPVGNLDLGDLSAGRMLATNAMAREGVEMSVGETADLMGAMAHAVGGETKFGAQQLAAQMDYQRRRKKAAEFRKRQMDKTKEMLSRKSKYSS